MIVSSFSDTRGDNTATMHVALEGDGVAALYIDAYVHMECPEHGKSYINHIEGEVACTTRLDKQDLNDLEAAIRGWPQPAHSLMWRTVRQILSVQGDQCDKVED